MTVKKRRKIALGEESPTKNAEKKEFFFHIRHSQFNYVDPFGRCSSMFFSILLFSYEEPSVPMGADEIRLVLELQGFIVFSSLLE